MISRISLKQDKIIVLEFCIPEQCRKHERKGSHSYTGHLSLFANLFGLMKRNTILLGVKLGLTSKKQSYPVIGTHPSPRSVSVWCSTSSSGSLSSTSKLTLCIHWSLTEDIAVHPWVVTRGRNYLVIMPLYSSIVIWKGSTQYVIITRHLQGLALWKITKIPALRVTPGSGLAQKEELMPKTPVET